jgi:hypothetical protein
MNSMVVVGITTFKAPYTVEQSMLLSRISVKMRLSTVHMLMVILKIHYTKLKLRNIPQNVMKIRANFDELIAFTKFLNTAPTKSVRRGGNLERASEHRQCTSKVEYILIKVVKSSSV